MMAVLFPIDRRGFNLVFALGMNPSLWFGEPCGKMLTSGGYLLHDDPSTGANVMVWALLIDYFGGVGNRIR